MKIEIKVPRMGESITEAIVGTIIKKSGSSVNTDDEVLELETDKVNQVVFAPKKGVLTLTVKEGDKVPVDGPLGYIETDGASAVVEKEEKETPQTTPKQEEKPPKQEDKPPEAKFSSQETIKYSEQDLISELKQGAAKPVKEKEVIKEKPSVTSPIPPASAQGERSERESRRKMPNIRQVIAQRLVAASQEAAMLTTFNEVDMTAVMDLRSKYQEEFLKKHGIKLGFMSFFAKASVSALKAFPLVNSYIDGNDIVERHYYDLSVAVSTDKGLMVPVIRDCDKLSFADIEKTLEIYAKKAREGKITVDELKGGGFTITNGGVFGSLLSTPFLNLPQCAILGMHKIEKRPVVVDDQIVIRPMMYLALSYDHRLIDGKEAVSFLVHIKNMIENPSRLLLQV